MRTERTRTPISDERSSWCRLSHSDRIRRKTANQKPRIDMSRRGQPIWLWRETYEAARLSPGHFNRRAATECRSILGFHPLQAVQVIDRALRMSGGGEDGAAVVLQNRKPVSDIGRVILPRLRAEFEVGAKER
jgi:hypothetical protein